MGAGTRTKALGTEPLCVHWRCAKHRKRLLAGLPKIIAASRRPSVEKIVDYFLRFCANMPIFPLVNRYLILIEDITPYLSIGIQRPLRFPGGLKCEPTHMPDWKGFHSWI